MAIISTLLAVGVGTIKAVAGSKGVSTGVSLAQGVFNQARNVAKARGRARVMIYADTGGTAQERRRNYLRQMAVFVPVLETQVGETGEEEQTIVWVVEDSGSTLPRDTFYNVNLSEGAESTSGVFPGSTDAREGFFYEFNNEGRIVGSSSDTRFIIQAGRLVPGDDVPRQLSENNRNAGGFRIWATGKVSTFRSANQIAEAVGGNIEF